MVEVEEGDEITDIDIKVGEPKKTYSIFGRVIYAENGLPVGGAPISYGILYGDGKRISGSGHPQVYANSLGEFHLKNVTQGKYAVFTTAKDFLEIGAGEEVSNLRLILAYGTLTLHGEIKIVGGTLPQDKSLTLNQNLKKDCVFSKESPTISFHPSLERCHPHS